MACKMAAFNDHRLAYLGVHKGPGVPQTSHLFPEFKKCIVDSVEVCGNAFWVFEYRMDNTAGNNGS
jgi:hypothetical protein